MGYRNGNRFNSSINPITLAILTVDYGTNSGSATSDDTLPIVLTNEVNQITICIKDFMLQDMR
ncbi:MAG: hypothetical protein PHD15_03425 [Clostridia bacterium]|nr:hypothetical protein [Clostridia bacterium]MDD4386792.1 hypothetical protein [Clostridia bacterium]